MGNKIIVVWLIVLTAWTGYQDFAMSHNAENRKNNLETRKKIFENYDARFETIEKFINEDLNDRFNNIETYIDKDVYPYLHQH